MRNKIIFALVVLGVLGATAARTCTRSRSKPLPPVFNPAPNPYAHGIYANGIVESYQANGENIEHLPRGCRDRSCASSSPRGRRSTQGTPLVQIDDTVQRATAEQQRSQADAARALLDELHAQPRKENLEVARAQVDDGARRA